MIRHFIQSTNVTISIGFQEQTDLIIEQVLSFARPIEYQNITDVNGRSLLGCKMWTLPTHTMNSNQKLYIKTEPYV